VTLYDQLQRAFHAEGINGSIVHVLLVLRMHNDTAHLDFGQAPSEREAREWMETEGRRLGNRWLSFVSKVIIRRHSPHHQPSTNHRYQSLDR
jgi:hypothetical protein